MTRPLEGIRVIEVGQFAFVAAATAVLAEWGAEVIKVEHPVTGDPQRATKAWDIEPGTGGFTYMLEVTNRGKKNIGIDLRNPAGREVLLRLVEQADVFVTNFLPDARRRLGLEVEDLRARNPRIVYARGSGYGPLGPEAEVGGFDGLAYWTRSGIAASLTPPGSPLPVGLVGPAFGDVQAGQNLAGGISAALLQRERTGEAPVVDCSLYATGLWQMQPSIVAAQVTDQDVLPIPAHDAVGNPLVNHYRTADGRFIMLGFLQSGRYWDGFCKVAGLEELAADPRFGSHESRTEHRRELTAALDQAFAARTCDEWREILAEQEGPWVVMQNPGEVLDDPQARANRYVQRVDYGDGRGLTLVSSPVQFDEQPGSLTPAPEHAADTELLLIDAGFGWPELLELKESGAIA